MTKYFALLDSEEVVPLGECKQFCDADDRAPPNTHWIFSEQGLRDLQDNIKEVLK